MGGEVKVLRTALYCTTRQFTAMILSKRVSPHSRHSSVGTAFSPLNVGPRPLPSQRLSHSGIFMNILKGTAVTDVVVRDCPESIRPVTRPFLLLAYIPSDLSNISSMSWLVWKCARMTGSTQSSQCTKRSVFSWFQNH